MCGIAGLFGAERNKDGPLRAMVKSQRHRGPDASGTYLDPTGLGALGHNRLSIIDLSPAGRQPMSSQDERFWIAFNGEIYNYLELRAELSGYPFRTRTDTEVILAAYERWGEGCLDRFVGMFAFLLWDAREQRLFAARDRFGVKPLCYAEVPGGGLALASETGALRAAGVPLEPDEVGWATYLARGLSDYSDRTFWCERSRQATSSLGIAGARVWRPGTTSLTGLVPIGTTGRSGRWRRNTLRSCERACGCASARTCQSGST